MNNELGCYVRTKETFRQQTTASKCRMQKPISINKVIKANENGGSLRMQRLKVLLSAVYSPLGWWVAKSIEPIDCLTWQRAESNCPSPWLCRPNAAECMRNLVVQYSVSHTYVVSGS
jgi:hypothetical protein